MTDKCLSVTVRAYFSHVGSGVCSLCLYILPPTAAFLRPKTSSTGTFLDYFLNVSSVDVLFIHDICNDRVACLWRQKYIGDQIVLSTDRKDDGFYHKNNIGLFSDFLRLEIDVPRLIALPMATDGMGHLTVIDRSCLHLWTRVLPSSVYDFVCDWSLVASTRKSPIWKKLAGSFQSEISTRLSSQSSAQDLNGQWENIRNGLHAAICVKHHCESCEPRKLYIFDFC